MLVKPQFELQPGQVGKGASCATLRCTRWKSACAAAALRWACRCWAE